MTEKNCKELVASELKSRIDDLNRLFDAWQKGIENIEDLGNLYEYGLSFDYVSPNTSIGQRKGYFRYQLSWGGPSDEFRIFVNPEIKKSNSRNEIVGLDITSIEYWYLDWFDGAKKKLTGKNLELLSNIFNSFFIDIAIDLYVKEMEESYD